MSEHHPALHLLDGVHYRQPLQIILRHHHWRRLRTAGLEAAVLFVWLISRGSVS
jgi:hypothetical protein